MKNPLVKINHTLKKMEKNNKGFSLVELIIVVAIMVALIAILAPQYIKYVQSSRDAVVKSAADEVLTVAKAEYALGTLTGEGTITVTGKDGNLEVTLGDGLDFDGNFVAICGIDADKEVNSDDVYEINIEIATASASDAGATFSMEKTEG